MDDALANVQIQWPGLRLPVLVLLDDPTPCRNPYWYEVPDQGHVRDVPNGFTERFADMIERTGAAGKFSVVPCPGAEGWIDASVPGVSDDDLAAFVGLVRERIAPRWDISPEMLTHNKALDLATMRPLPEREDVWAEHQDESTLTPYIARGLQALRNVGLEPNGVTSPWAFGIEVEEAYVNAMVTALRDVCGVTLGWYFLHGEWHAPVVPPRVMRLQPASGTALVSLVSASPEISPNHHDFAWRTQFGEAPVIDALLTADGAAGRLADLFRNGSPIIFHTHWQSLFSNGTGSGLDGLTEVCERINRAWDERIRWTSAREMAIYSAAREATRFAMQDGGRRLSLRAPFACFEFAFTVPSPGEQATPHLDGIALDRLPDGRAPLTEGTWRRDGDVAHLCIALSDGAEIEWR